MKGRGGELKGNDSNIFNHFSLCLLIMHTVFSDFFLWGGWSSAKNC